MAMRGMLRHGIVLLAVPIFAGTGCTRLFSTSQPRIISHPTLPGYETATLRNLVSFADASKDATHASYEMMRLTAEADERTIVAYLRSVGFYDASVSNRMSALKGEYRVTYDIDTGPRYRVKSFVLNWPSGYTGPQPRMTNRLEYAAAGDILATSASVVRRLRETGYPAPRITNQSVIVDHAANDVTASYDVIPGHTAVFGTASATGLRRLRQSYIAKATPWKPDTPYDIRKVELLEQRLAASGLFSSIQSRREDSTGNNDVYDLSLTLRERKPRTLQFGAGYRTDTGAEGSAQWEHRNLFGEGEDLVLRGNINGDGFETELRLTIPFFRRPDQQWGNSLIYSREDTDAYLSRSLRANTWILRSINRHLSLKYGISLRYLDETQNANQELYYLISGPIDISWDKTDNRLNATRGHKVLFQTEPFLSIEQPDQYFWKNLATINGFQPFNRSRSWLAALRVTAGSISGDALTSIPADERFYAGGGQSVRGYEYQSVSPRDGDDIIGGLSLLETSLEIRGRLTHKFGVVAFLDGGSAYEDHIPAFDEAFRWGAGAGIRYFTPVGPLRFDVGIPLNRRRGLDDSWQFYISIGQAF